MMTILMLSPANSAPQMLSPATHSLFEVSAGVGNPLQHLCIARCVFRVRGREREGEGGRGREVCTNFALGNVHTNFALLYQSAQRF